MTGDVAILRRCRCCDLWVSIDAFKPLGRLCEPCVYGQRTGRVALSRCMQITPKGRAYLRELHEQERSGAAA